MASADIILDQAAITRLLKSPQGMVGVHLIKAANAVERSAKRLCPVDTGRLRASITHRIARDAQGLLALVGSNVHYAIFVELGTRYQRAQPYLRPALRSAIRGGGFIT